MSEEILVHAAIARALHELGVETMFGLMGDSNLFMVDAFVRNHQGRYVPATHEGGAVLMALGHAAMTGEVGAATITQGPALSNALTALIDGVKGTVPIVLLSGDTPISDPEHSQAVAQREMIVAAGAGYERLLSPETIAADVARAFRRAGVERRPIVLNMPTDMMWEQATYSGIPQTPRASANYPADGNAVDDAVGILAAARRPVVLAGRGAAHARDALIKLADRIGAPVATTLKAKGLFNGAPFDLGVFGTLSTPAASEAIAASDCIISFGAGLNRFTTYKGSHLDGRRLIQVDDTLGQIGRRAQPDAALTGDPALVAETLVKWLEEADIPSSQATDALDGAALREPVPMPRESNREGTVDLSRALQRIDDALPEDRVYVTDGGRFLNEAWTRIGVSGPENMLLSINTGAIGLGVGYAIGAAVARPAQRTLLVTGDGGFMMGGLAEFASVVRENLDMVVVVCNDSAYGAEYIQFEDRQMDPALSMFDWPPLAQVATAMGARGMRVTSAEELDAAIDEMGTGEGPMLIELMLDPATIPRLHV